MRCSLRKILLFCFLLSSFALSAQHNNPDSINALLRTAPDREKLGILSNQANALRYNNPEQALDYASQAIEIATRLNDVDALAKNHQLAGGLYFRSGAFARSKDSYMQALNDFSQARNEKGKAEVNNALASLYYAEGNLIAAVQGHLDALRYYETANDKAGLLNTLSNLGNIYTKQNNFSKAIEYNLRAIKLYEESSDKLRTLVSYDNIGNIYLRQGNYVKAEEFFNKSLRIYREINNRAGMASALNQLGNIESRQEHVQQALGFYKSSLKLSDELNMQPLTVANLNSMGESYYSLGQYDEAIGCYKRAITISKSIGLKIELDVAYQGMAEIYRLTKEVSKAQAFNAMSHDIRDSLYNDSIVKRLADAELRFEAEKKQIQIELLSKEQTIKETELLRERQLRNVFISALSILLVIFVILVYFFIQNKRIAHNLERQKNELQEKNTAILEQSEKLNQLNTVKDRFFSIISHDLRNNLTSMKLYFDLVSHPGYEASDNSEVTKNIAGSVENTIDLLENLLIWASAQIKGVPIHIQKLNIHSLVQENLDLLHNAAAQKQIEVTNDVDAHTTAYADMDMIRLVLRNLLANAIKFTSEQGVITVASRIERDHCIVSVKDNGVGISKDAMERLFSQHQNPTTKGTANEKGTGLGLILCKDFIERNNGRIWAESEEGKGSTFVFTLPVVV